MNYDPILFKKKGRDFDDLRTLFLLKLFSLFKKDSIIFALYSSNWTEMDMKCKRLILLMMKLNNANHKKLKFTRTKIVNLEMFFKVSTY